MSTTTSIPQASEDFDPQFVLQTGHARVGVRPETRATGELIVELTDDQESNLLLSPAEALSVAAALSAVATFQLEERTLVRRTEAGAPAFEEGI